MKTAIIIPVLNAGPWLDRLLPALKKLDPAPGRILFIDSSSKDSTQEEVRKAGFDLHIIRREDFGHGKTRNLGATLCADADILIYLTQDALPQDSKLVANMLAAFEADPKAGVVFGRQLPHEDATVAARYARLHNYPPESRTTTADDIPQRGLKALFCSNSFAAYRASALRAVGGFPEELPLGEDMAITGRMLEAGYHSVYRADATVAHSHNYSSWEEFRRYFDIGALLKTDPWLAARSLKSGGEGLKFVQGEFRYTLAHGGFMDIISIIPRTAAKLIGFKLGQRYRSLPYPVLKTCSMHSYYWKQAS